MTPRPKVPVQPPDILHREARDVVSCQAALWRIHRTRGRFVLPWNAFRRFGPLASARWDPHPAPPGEYPGAGITYVATDLRTALAEVFQTTRHVDSTDATAATSWTPSRPLRLLDLTGNWALRNQAAYALATAPRRTCRAWSRVIRQQWPDLDGLLAPSTLTGSPILALYESAGDSFPDRPAFSRPLSTPLLWTLVADAADSIGYTS